MYKNKTAIVTGGASGIGKEMCKYLTKRGAAVILADINKEAARKTAEELDKNSGTCKWHHIDVTNQLDIEDCVKETKKKFGKIDLIINNAAIGIDGEFKDINLKQFKKVIEINLWGVIYGTYSVYPIMMEQGYGQIVNVSSLAGLLPGGLMTSYTASKHAVTGFSLGLRPEAKEYGIKVNVLCPGFIETEIHDNTEKVSDYLNSEKNKRNKNRFPPAEKCIKSMMRGIEKDKAIIISPAAQKIYWWMYRFCPNFILFAWEKIIKKLKK